MTLVDAGPLIALIDAREPDHEVCVAVLDDLHLPLLTTWPVMTEAMHLVRRKTGWPGQERLWQLVLGGSVEIAAVDSAKTERAATLMHKYRDRPMDLADATLVAVGEARSVRQIFTLDRDFDVYRLHGRQMFQVLPS